MEDVCDLSHLLQTERHEKEELEKSLSEVDSSLDIENQRFKQEGESCSVMMKRKAELKHRVQDVCESMEINMARLEQVATDIQNCDSALIVPKVEEYTKRRDEILDDIDDSQTRISVIESEMTETLLAEYNEISASVKSLNSTNTTKSLELCELQDQDTHLTARLHVLDNQIKTQKSEIDSGRKMLLEFDTAVEEKKHAIFLGCESLRLYQTERRIESDKAEGDQQCAKDLYDTTVEEVKALTESICTETGKLVNATDCHNIIANKRLDILQQLSTLKKEEERMLAKIKDNEAIVRTEKGEVYMLSNALSVTSSSITAQQMMKTSNDNQVMCSIMDSNVDEEVVQLKSNLAETEDVLKLLMGQLNSNSNPKLREVLEKIAEATANQTKICEDLQESRECVEGLNHAIQQKKDAAEAMSVRLEIVLRDISTLSTTNSALSSSVGSLQAEHTQLVDLSPSHFPSTSSSTSSLSDVPQLQNCLKAEQDILQEKEASLGEKKQRGLALLQAQTDRRLQRKKAVVVAEREKRVFSKKRVLQELNASEVSNKRNQLEAVGETYIKEAKQKEHLYLQEKAQLEQEHARLLNKVKPSGSNKGASSGSSGNIRTTRSRKM